ncbi:endonuclease domain-containing protein [Ferruginibacter sp.]
MFEGASHLIFENAKQLRKNMTAAEIVLWVHLKAGINGLKFRRQHPIGLYVADFYCHKVKMIVELDGSIHNEITVKQNDERRQKELQNWGYSVIRFPNEEVLATPEIVIEKITKKILELNNIQKQNTPEKAGSKSPL